MTHPADELIDDAYLDASRSATAWVRALSADILETLGLWRHDGAAPLPEWVARLGVVPDLAGALAWLLGEARDLGAVEAVAPDSYRPLPFAVGEALERAEEEVRRYAQGVGSSLEMLSYIASRYPDFLRGERAGGTILYKGPALEMTTRYFSAANPLYDVHNQLGWLGVKEALARLGRPARVVELGAGSGGGTAAVLRGLAAGHPGAVESLTITDIAPSFLLATAERLGPESPVKLGHRRLDFTRSPLEQKWEAGSVDVLLAVNALHNAADPVAALGKLRPLLAPDGFLVLSESVCGVGAHVHQDFVFNLLPQASPASRFFPAEAWERILGEAGYSGEVHKNSRGPQLALLAITHP